MLTSAKLVMGHCHVISDECSLVMSACGAYLQYHAFLWLGVSACMVWCCRVLLATSAFMITLSFILVQIMVQYSLHGFDSFSLNKKYISLYSYLLQWNDNAITDMSREGVVNSQVTCHTSQRSREYHNGEYVMVKVDRRVPLMVLQIQSVLQDKNGVKGKVRGLLYARPDDTPNKRQHYHGEVRS